MDERFTKELDVNEATGISIQLFEERGHILCRSILKPVPEHGGDSRYCWVLRLQMRKKD